VTKQWTAYGVTSRMLFSELYKLIVNKVTFLGFRGGRSPHLDPPLGGFEHYGTRKKRSTLLLNGPGLEWLFAALLLQHPSPSQQAASRVRRVMSAFCEVTQAVGDTWTTCPTLLRGFWARSKAQGSVVEVHFQLTFSFLVVEVESCRCRFCSSKL